MPPVYEALLLNTVVPQIQAAQAGDSYVMVVNATTPALRITQTGTGNALEVEDSANPDATPFVVSAAGDVGIGTNTPSNKLTVNSGAATTTAQFTSTGSSVFLGMTNSGASAFIGADSAGSFIVQTPGSSYSTKLTVDTSGNLGLGVTPKAWQSAPALEGTSFAINPLLGVDQTGFSTGCYQDVYGLDTGWKSKGAYRPTLYAQNGSHIFYVSTAIPTGANQAITFTQAMTLDASGNLLVGQTSAGLNDSKSITLSKQFGVVYVNHLTGQTTGDQYAIFAYAGSSIGSITQSGTTAVLYNVTSDQRLKENIQDAAPASALIDSLQVRQFDWKSDNFHQRYGFVAQELVTVVPEAVHQPTNPDEMMAVDYSKLVPMLVKEIQSLRARVAQLEQGA